MKRIEKQQGVKGLVLFLKVNCVLIQQSLAGHKIPDVSLLGPRVSRTKLGLPRILPTSVRIRIRNRQPGWDREVRFYLSILYLYRVLKYPSKLSFSSIVDSGVEFDLKFFKKYIYRYLHLISKGWLLRVDLMQWMSQKFKLFPILKASPNTSDVLKNPLPILSKIAKQNLVRSKSISHYRWYWSTHPAILSNSIWNLYRTPNLSEPMISLSKFFTKDFARIFSRGYKFEDLFPDSRLPLDYRTSLGKLGIKEEAAGKVRLFAMVDPLTQWLFYPLHRLLFSILKKVPMDGTFNQVKPVTRLIKQAQVRSLPLYSLDLSSATDRLPVSIQSELLNQLFKRWLPNFGDQWRHILTSREYKLTSLKYGVDETLIYKVGQPMGALSSWAMLAFVHHFIVQVSAWSSGHPKNKLFRDYAILGDDLVLASTPVKNEYLRILNMIGVKCGLHKSILSPKGLGLEFAKKTFLGDKDVSPISWLELSESLTDATTWVAFSHKYKLSIRRQLWLLGHGYISRGKPFNRLSHACQYIWLSNITKVDFSSDKLAWRGTSLKLIEKSLPIFMEEVITPLKADISRLKSQSALDWFWTDESWNRPSRVRLWLWDLHHYVYRTEAELTKVRLGRLEGLLFRAYKIKSLTEAIQLYMLVIREKAITMADQWRLLPIRVVKGDGRKLPIQVKLFRRWSRALRRVRKTVCKQSRD